MGHDTGGGAILTAFVLGAITGAAAALLLAPGSGEDTRRVIKERTDQARARANEAAKQGREFIDRQRDTFQTAIDSGKEAYHRTRETTEEQA